MVCESSPAVKRRRPYSSPRRKAQAALTRAAILDAARRRFVARGYSATSVADVAEEAGVALKTVQAIFGTKRELLLAVWHRAIAGDGDESVPVAERRWFGGILDEPDPRRQIELVARGSRAVKGRAGDVMEVVRNAAPSEPEIAELWTRLQREFLEHQTAVVRSLADKGALRDELPVEEAAQRLWLLNHPAVYHLLVSELGWSPDRYVHWLTEAVQVQLLRAPLGGATAAT